MLSRSQRRPVVLAMAFGTAAVGVAVLTPNLYSDPNGLDPYDLRITGVAASLCGLAFAVRRLVAARAVLLGLAAVAVSYSAWLYLPQFIYDRGSRISGPAYAFWASMLQAGVTLAACAIALRFIPTGLRAGLRLRRVGLLALLFTVGGVIALVIGGLLLPATWFGREGLPLVALGPGGSTDMLWLGPANALQAAAQELQFRGLLLGALERVLPPHWANAGQALLFGLAHLAIVYQGPLAPFVPLTAVVGFLFGWVTQRTGSLWPAIIVHAIADIAITAVVLPGLYGY